MVLLTSLTFSQLAKFIKEKKIALHNTDLFIKPSDEAVVEYFDTLMGNSGFVLGFTGVPFDAKTLAMFRELVKDPDLVVLEISLDNDEAQVFSINGLDKVAEAVYYNMSSTEIIEALNSARIPKEAVINNKRPAVACIPLLSSNFKIRVAALQPDVALEISAKNITVIRMGEEISDGNK